MTNLVPVRKGHSTQISLAEIQDRLDARNQIAETRTPTSTRKSRVEKAKSEFAVNPLDTLVEIQEAARALANVFDASITSDSAPFSQEQINQISDEFMALERLRVQIEAMEDRYRELTFAHLDETVTRVPGRPVSQTPGKMEADGPGDHYIFERRGGNRANPDLNTETLRGSLSSEVAAQIYVTIHHPAVPAWDEEVFDEAKFGQLVDEGIIDLDDVAPHLTPGKWRTPSFYKTLVKGD